MVAELPSTRIRSGVELSITQSAGSILLLFCRHVLKPETSKRNEQNETSKTNETTETTKTKQPKRNDQNETIKTKRMRG